MFKFMNLKIGFAMLIGLLLFLGFISLNKIHTISEQTEKIYNHPFKVSRSAITIQSHLTSMHRYMKDVVLSKSDNELAIAMAKVDFHEERVLQEYATIFKYYLGPKKDIDDSYKAFINWKPIREEVISLVGQNKIDDAAFITKNKGALHVIMLNNKIQVLVNFASNKADEFYFNAIEYDEKAKEIILFFLVILIIMSVIISKITIENMNKNLKEKEAYLKKIEELSITDSLTSMYNRRHFDTLFSKYLKLINRLDKQMVFMMFDIDNFKKYNDTYGHQAGDEVLKQISQVLKSKLQREDDNLFRIGGEEFALLFIVNDKSNVVALCNNIINAVRDLKIEHEKNEPFGIVTISMGVGIIDNSHYHQEQYIYEKVDNLLYEVKNNGKNMFKIGDIS